MTRCERSGAGSVVAGGGGLRLWPVFSTAGFRRKLLEAVVCGVSLHRNNGDASTVGSPERPEGTSASDPRKNQHGSDRLLELLTAEASEARSDQVDVETRRRIEALEELQGVVRRLQLEESGGVDLRRQAAGDVRRLAKDDPEARETLAMLGAIPPLVGMLDSDDLDLQVAALYGLLNLGIGNDRNKAAIVKSGAAHKMLDLIESESSPSVSEAIVANFLGLSALDSNKSIIGSSGVIPHLVKTFQNPNPAAGSSQARQDALRALFNLSIAPSNIPHLVESDLVPSLLAAFGDMEVSERTLAVLSNLVSAPEGRRAVIRAVDALPALVDVLNWFDAPGCQEKAAYVLMVMAHKSGGRSRAAMIEAGIVSALLELTLLGSALVQKRASRVLEFLRVDKGKQVSEGFVGGGGCSGVPAVSAPICRGPSEGKVMEDEGEEEEDDMGMSEERMAVRQLVNQSLQSNMRRIVRRANLPQDFALSDHFKALTSSSTSKSLPF